MAKLPYDEKAIVRLNVFPEGDKREGKNCFVWHDAGRMKMWFRQSHESIYVLETRILPVFYGEAENQSLLLEGATAQVELAAYRKQLMNTIQEDYMHLRFWIDIGPLETQYNGKRAKRESVWFTRRVLKELLRAESPWDAFEFSLSTENEEKVLETERRETLCAAELSVVLGYTILKNPAARSALTTVQRTQKALAYPSAKAVEDGAGFPVETK